MPSKGTIHKLIQEIVEKNSKGNKTNASFTRTKIMTNLGVNINKYDENTPDDQEVINKLKDFAQELGINLNN